MIGRLFAAIWGGLDGVRKILHLLLLLVLFIVLVGTFSGTAPSVLPSHAALLVQPVGALVEQLDGDPYDRALAEFVGEAPPQTLVQDVLNALALAQNDSRIGAVHLELSGLGGAAMSNLRRVADALTEFRASGKTVIASADYYSQSAYYLAAHADAAYMHPEGLLLMQGFGAFRTYYKDALDTLKIDWNVFRVGTHKSFVEPYTRMDMSPEDRESRQRLIDQFWSHYTVDIEAARGLETGAVNGFAQNVADRVAASGGDIATAAVDAGLVDALVGRAELRAMLGELVGFDASDDTRYSAIGMAEYLAVENGLATADAHDANVAVIVAVGNILDGSQPPGTIGGDSTAELLRRAQADSSVDAVVLRVDSGGGSLFASEVIAHEVTALRQAGKPVVASMGAVAASGGYWISVGADRVMASPTTITGSIGVFGMFPTYNRTLNALGMATDGVGTTPLAGQLRPDRALSDDAKRLIQTIVTDSYDDFISNVAELRGMEKDAVDRVAQGQVWTGTDALAHGLIDELGSLDDAIAAAAELAGLEEDDYGVIQIEPTLSPTEQAVLDLLATARSVGIDAAAFAPRPSLLEVIAGRLQRALVQLTQFNDPKGTYVHCFCELE